MKIKDLPDSSKPRERFLKHGPEALSDAELFAILLRTGVVGENVMEMSNHLISKFGLLTKLFDSSLNHVYHGPDSNVIKLKIFKDENTGEYYKFTPIPYVCPPMYAKRLKGQKIKNEELHL